MIPTVSYMYLMIQKYINAHSILHVTVHTKGTSILSRAFGRGTYYGSRTAILSGSWEGNIDLTWEQTDMTTRMAA